MMRAVALAVSVIALLAGPLHAQDEVDPLSVIDTAFALAAEDRYEESFAELSRGLRLGRARGFDNPDWGVVFAMLADFYRNDRGNAAYALELTDEGLTVAARWGEEAGVVTSMLRVSRAYALADLGRHAEALEVAALGMPDLRKWLGDDYAADLSADMERWQQGLGADANLDPLVLAREALVKAGQAVDAGELGRAVLLGAAAILPEDTGLDPEEVRRLAAEAGMITGRALFTMGRGPESLDVLTRAMTAAIDVDASRSAGRPVWRQDPGVGLKRLGMLFYWYGRAAMDQGRMEEADLGYTLAEVTLEDPALRHLAGFGKARMMQLRGDEAGSVVVLRRIVEEARANDDADNATTAEFYIAMSDVRTEGSSAAMTRLTLATEAAIAAKPEAMLQTRAFFLSEASQVLANQVGFNPTALDFARRAIAMRLEFLQQVGDSAQGQDSQRREIALDVATLLLAANIEASQRKGSTCPEGSLDGCVIIVENR